MWAPQYTMKREQKLDLIVRCGKETVIKMCDKLCSERQWKVVCDFSLVKRCWTKQKIWLDYSNTSSDLLPHSPGSFCVWRQQVWNKLYRQLSVLSHFQLLVLNSKCHQRPETKKIIKNIFPCFRNDNNWNLYTWSLIFISNYS